MAGEQVSVTEAADVLGVHPQRIHQRIRDGSLPAEKVGHQWVVQLSDLNRLKRHAGPGRPLSPRSAWDLLAIVDERVASGLNPSARSRARSRVHGLLNLAQLPDPEDTSVRLVRALGHRARHELFAASARDLPSLRGDGRLHLSGVCLPESNISVVEFAEGYVRAGDVDGLVDEHLLSRAPRSRANVLLHVVPSATAHPVLAELERLVRSPLVLAADLAEHDGIREKNRALQALVDLQERLQEPTSERPGGDGD